MTEATRTPWWVDAVTYQVYIRSFCDASGDGIGDVAGIRSKLPYLSALGIDAVWITPFYRSPMADHGYDVADYYDVDPMFGSLAEMDGLLADAHGLGLKVIVDVVPNHTSSQHAWFREALADPSSPARSRYHFADPAPDGGPPNNWTSVFGGPAWTLDRASGQYYLHLFAPEQPDLNWRNPEVHEEWERILRFWLDRGVDGFRIDVAHGLYKHPELESIPEPKRAAEIVAGTEYSSSIVSSHLWDRPEVHEVFRRWREITDEYDDRAMVGEVFLFDIDRVVRYVRPGELHMAFNFMLMGSPFDAVEWRRVIDVALDKHSSAGAATCTWVLSSHDVTRHATRYGGGDVGRRRAAAAVLTILALPGAAYLFQGEELGLEDVDVPPQQRQDPIWTRSGGAVTGRDGCRAPIPWTSDGPGYGFTSGTPWLPFGPDAADRSAEAQLDDDSSMLSFYREALEVRRKHTPGSFAWLASGVPAGALAFRHGDLLCALNTSKTVARLPLTAGARVLLASAPGVTLEQGVLSLPADTATWLRAADLGTRTKTAP
jgi:alpha-glucosidase